MQVLYAKIDGNFRLTDANALNIIKKKKKKKKLPKLLQILQ